MKTPKIIMLGTAIDSSSGGGIHSVLNLYKDYGLFNKWPITFIATHNTKNTIGKMFIFLSSFLTFLTELLVNNVKLIHIHSSFGFSFYRKSFFIIPGKLFKSNIMLHIHGSQFIDFYNKSNLILKYIIKFILSQCDCILVLSKKWYVDIKSIVPKANCIILYNPAPLTTPSINWENKDNSMMLFMGRLGQRKGIYDILKSLEIVNSRDIDFKIIICGDGEIESVKKIINESKFHDKIQVLGWVSGEAKYRLFKKAAIFLLPSYFEGLPISILEAMSFGLAVISTPIGGIPDAITDGQEGIIVNAGDIDKLAAAIIKLLNNPNITKKMGAAGQEKISNCFTPKIVIPELEKIYREFGIFPL